MSTSLISLSPSVDVPPERPWPRKSKVITPVPPPDLFSRGATFQTAPCSQCNGQREAVGQDDRQVVLAGQGNGVDSDAVVGHQRPRFRDGPSHAPILRAGGRGCRHPTSKSGLPSLAGPPLVRGRPVR